MHFLLNTKATDPKSTFLAVSCFNYYKGLDFTPLILL